ncbi:MAG: CDGSH iron-sulfur domain-containing protein [Alphaproteobacteria bacterium]|nr:CDGSH iron-sulfur domain-containing protein [Alphaproteobacteria bacterium]
MASNAGDSNATIECAEDGPYIVKGCDRLVDAAGAALATRKLMALCRCGGSAKKPFCDGTHAKIGFSGARVADGSEGRRESYLGKAITIHDNRAICAHAGVCTDRLSSVWRMNEEPWIDADGASVEAIMEVIRACPSGALSYSVDGAEGMSPAAEPVIRVSKDGPYHVTGGVELADAAWGEGASRDRYTLCRCGASKNKPFCDGSHWDVGFKDGGG